MVDMVSRFTSEVVKVGREVESGPCCAMSLLEDVIPLYHVSAGVCTVSRGMGLWRFPNA